MGKWPHLLAQLLGWPQAASRSAPVSLRDSWSPPCPSPSLVTVSYPHSLLITRDSSQVRMQDKGQSLETSSLRRLGAS